MSRSQRKRALRQHSRNTFFTLIFSIVFILAFASASVYADDDTPTPSANDITATVAPTDVPSNTISDPATDVPTDQPTDVPTDIPTAAPTDVPTDVPTAAPTDAPTDTPTDVVTDTPTDVATATDTPAATETPTDAVTVTSTATPEVTISIPPTKPPSTTHRTGSFGNHGIVGTSCQMDINDAGDSDPYTFNFAAINTNNIASYQWTFGDGQTSTNQADSHAYTAPGTYNVTLTCVPPTGSNLVLNGTITISNPTIAAFTLTPGTQGFSPFTINLVNTSTGSGLTYLWEVTGPEPTQTATTENATFILTTAGAYTITLTVSDSGGQSAVATAGVVVKVPPPLADFTLTPATGAPPLDVTVVSIMDPTSGPVDTWTWDFGDGSPTVVDTTPSTHIHTYTLEGVYPITLTYVGPSGNGMVMRQVAVYTAGTSVNADFTYALNGNSGGGMEVCFTNTSTGPVVTNSWDFGDGSPIVVDNSAVVCHVYMSENNFDVELTVVAADPSVTSTGRRTVSVVFAPIASFTATPSTMEAGDKVNFDSTSSTGFITDWAWDFNGDGVTDSTQQNPANIPFNTIGGNTVTLTVTGPGGSSTAQMVLTVQRAEITCDFSGNLTPTPGSNILYDGVVTNLRGRTATYSWTITGPDNFSFTTEDATVAWATVGSYLVTFSASTPDGASCSKTKSIQVQWPDLTCAISGTFNPSPNGNNNTYTVSVGNLAGRTATYTWFIDGVQQPETGNSLTRSWTLPTTSTLSVHIGTADGSGDCTDSKNLNVQWPALTCSISGNANPLPQLPDDPTRSYVYTANLGGLDGRSVTYQWYVDGVLQVGETNPTLTLSWAWNQTGPYTVRVDVVADNRDSTTTPCSTSKNLNVNVPALVCNTPFGDNTPVLNETVTYTRNVANQFNRAITGATWTLQQTLDNGATWLTVATGSSTNTDDPITYLFDQADGQYRIQYTINVTMPDEGCTSAWETITVPSAGVDFICEFGPNGNMSPSNPASNYTYQVSVDNTNHLPLQFTWVLVDSSGGERVLATNTSTIDGIVNSPAISGAAMGPADNYTLRVDVETDPLLTTYKCSLSNALVVGTLNVNYTFTVNNNAVEVGQDICLTNVSNTSYGDINSLTYSWDFGTASNSLGSQTSTAQQPGCLSYPNPGTYNITLVGTNASGNRSATVTYTFHVYGHQSIAINHSNQSIAPATMTFSAVSVNLSAPYTWTFTNLTTGTVVGTRIGQNVTFNFGTAGDYEATVSASGPLGVTSASAQFTLLSVNDIRAAFTPSTYNGPAPLNVCFTDHSVGNNIVSWAWDFDNNGTIDSTQQNPCTTFSTPAHSYMVRLTIKNSSNLSATATNVIHTFNTLEAHSTFTIIPQGSGLYCFQSVLSGGTVVTSWDFGDGTTVSTGSLNYVCHQYNSSGTYAVTMNITDGATTGSITRPVNVVLTSTPPTPTLHVSVVCTLNGITFTVSNSGQSMTTPDSLNITDATGAVVVVDDTLLLASGASKSYTIPNSYGTLTLTTVDTHLSFSTYCNLPPSLTGSVICQPDGSVQFIIANSSTDTDASQSYTVTDGSGNTVQTGTVNAARNSSQTITVSGYHAILTFTTSGTPAVSTTVTLNSSCAEPPVLAASSICQIDGTVVFTVTNTSSATNANQSYTVTDNLGNVVQTGTITAAANGGTQTITVNNAFLNKPVTLSSNGGAQGATTVISNVRSCNQPPVLTGAASCTVAASIFTITNNSQDTAANQSYTITDGSGNTVATGTITTAANGGTQTITLTGVYGTLNFASSGSPASTTTVNINNNCQQPPVLSAASICHVDGSVDFVITNTSAHTAANQPYTITDSLGNVVQTGTITAAANGGTQTITIITAFLNKPVTLNSNGGAQGPTTVVTSTQSCNQPPVLTGVASCTVAASIFTITNSSQDTAAGQPYTITDGSGNTVATGTITANPNGGTQTITLTGVYGVLHFATVGTPTSTTTVNLNNNCQQPPVLSASALCQPDGSAVFTITNTSLHTAANQSYTITDSTSAVVQTGTITAAANGGTQTITVPKAYVNTPVTLTSNGGAQGPTTVLNMSQNCDEPPMLSGNAICTADGAAFTVINSSKNTAASQGYRITDTSGSTVQTGTLNIPVLSRITIAVHGVYGNLTLTTQSPTQGVTATLSVDITCAEPGTGTAVSMSLTPTPLPAEAIAGIPVNVAGSACSRGCIDLQVYHTNRNGHWDIYRLGNVNGDQTDSGINLTDTNGKYDNMAPSRSPNAEWIVFTSNRDGNWELYLAPTNGDIGQTRRLTFNDTAIDTDPAWGPNNFVVFETNRNGNWDLYLLDMMTDQFYQLTTSKGNDVNPDWSNDGSKVVFQSDRSGQWQVYEMDMTTFQIRLLSDGKGNDMDPTYSDDGSHIAFRSDRDGVKSAIYIMNPDGSNPTQISDPAGYATNHSWSPNSNLIAYQSDLDGDLDVYVYDLASGQTRKLTDNTIPDYAPTWRCATNQVIFTSDVSGTPDIYETRPLPITDPGILVDKQADQMTNSTGDNIYPEGAPVEENASREGRLPDLVNMVNGETVFLKPDVSLIPPDLSIDVGDAWEQIGDTCVASPDRTDLVHMTPED